MYYYGLENTGIHSLSGKILEKQIQYFFVQYLGELVYRCFEKTKEVIIRKSLNMLQTFRIGRRCTNYNGSMKVGISSDDNQAEKGEPWKKVNCLNHNAGKAENCIMSDIIMMGS